MFDFAEFYPVAGLLSVIVFVIPLAVSVRNDKIWMLGQETISHLATDGYPLAAIMFNAGCVLSGMFSFIFGMGLLTADGLKYWAAFPFMIASLGIIMVGVIDRSYGKPHRVAAGIYFFSAVVSISMTVASCIIDGPLWAGIFGCVLLSTMVLMAVTQRIQVFEPYLVFGNCTWTVLLSILLML
ncbi:MAG: DUF998 domain-containing protein [Candidatus Methanomethylophilaceae archaeon]|nr:DUF998 domain-containing protein [Candidatus Methanomethylophilaceae archaeon]MBP5394618.1 DUF998 domain-containing protein [Candidatus Methanomethylophilaceae archaeon]